MGGRIITGNRTDRSGAVIMIGFPLPREGDLPKLPEADPEVDDD